MVAVESGIRDDSLLQLYLQQCRRLGVEPKSSLLRVFHEQHGMDVEELDLSGVLVLSAASLQDVLSVLSEGGCANLKSLNLSNNEIHGEAVPYLCHVCKGFPALTHLDLSRNPALGYASAKYLIDLVKRHRTMVSLNVDQTAIVQTTKNLLSQYLKQNNSKLPPLPMSARTAATQNAAQQSSVLNSLPLSWQATDKGEILAAAAADWNQYTPAPPASKRMMGSTRRHQRPDTQQSQSEVASSPTKSLAPVTPTTTTHYNPDGAPLTREVRYVSSITKEPVILREAWTNLEERIQQQHKTIAAQARKDRHDLHAKHQQGLNVGFDYVENCTFPSKYNLRQLIEEIVSDPTLSDLSPLQEKYQPSVPMHQLAIGRVLGLLLDTAAGATEHTTDLSKELDGLLKPFRLGYLGDFALPLHRRLQSPILDIRHLKEELRASEPRMKALVFEIETSERNRLHALEDEDPAGAEQFHDTTIALNEDLMSLTQDRLQALDWRGGQKQCLEELEEFLRMMRARTEGDKDHHDELLKRLDGTMKSLDFKREREDILNSQSLFEFQHFKKTMMEDMHTNERRQNRCWEAIIQGVEDLQRLGDERGVLSQRLLDAGEQEGKRKSDYSTFVQVFDKRYDELINLKDQVQNFIDAIGQFEKFGDDVRTHIRERLDKLNEAAAVLLLEEQRNYHQNFSKAYKNIGDLIFRKEKRLEEIERVMRSNEFQRGSSVDVLDPEVKAYTQRAQSLERLKEEVTRKLDLLRQRADKMAEDFEPTQDVLDGIGGFLDPTLELQETNISRRGTALKKLESFQDVEKEGVVGERVNIVDLKRATQMAKDNGLRSLMSPSRPSSTRTGKYILMSSSPNSPTTSPRRVITLGDSAA